MPDDAEGRSSMKLAVMTVVGVVPLIFSAPAIAEITFRCDAGAGTECAFSVIHPDGKGTTNFVLGPGKTNGLNDQFAGGKYCVVVSKPRAQVKDWPPNCISAIDSTKGKIVENLKAGGTYN